ncbi:pentapeptide repeat-containing protein [Marinomonas sp. M1K-6]|uniref:Pentapeptide repeat-containing protein n=1 Tax=Marinomonas profundi TaxID=2726122 RepID=A0A847RAB8_9GAMM|nr:pentapeptide repeat-containing protein [Marinomonas profundi]NLQ17904.1 pentapeptide repeat-containing protein [Marinomonas profundi]UDV03441.1 pentapeptide repeat-containing protein [Marinomonas profundi]
MDKLAKTRQLPNEDAFEGQTFTDLSMVQESVSRKVFESCVFDSCDFTEAFFDACTFKDCQFRQCKLTAVNVRNSKFSEVQFYESKVLGVDWTKAYWRGLSLGSSLFFKECLVNASSFYGLKQSGIVFEDCRAHDVDFREATLSRARFSGTDLSNSLFVNTNLTGADFNGATHYDIDVTRNILKGAIFCRYEAVGLLTSLGIKLV